MAFSSCTGVCEKEIGQPAFTPAGAAYPAANVFSACGAISELLFQHHIEFTTTGYDYKFSECVARLIILKRKNMLNFKLGWIHAK